MTARKDGHLFENNFFSEMQMAVLGGLAPRKDLANRG
jgi:hypothetical protein